MAHVYLTDTTLRDGNHTVSHSFSPEEAAKIAKSLEDAGIDLIEVGHGDGIGGSTINYGHSKYSDIEVVKAVSKVLTKSKLTVLLLPGIGLVEDLHEMKKLGVKAVRIATHVTEADISHQHIKAAKEMGFFVVGFLMMAHMASTEKVVEEALKMESYGADVVYVTDSAGALLPAQVTERVTALRKALKCAIGHHSHNNLGLAVANSIAAVEAGATYIDGSLSGLGAGAGNTSTELVIAAFNKSGIETSADLFKAMDASKDVLIPILEQKGLHIHSNLDPMILGYAGVYSSFLLHARRNAKTYGLDVRDILIELGRRKAVGGQEDWIIEICNDLVKAKGQKSTKGDL